jgi:hypothetical protein
MQMRDLEFYRGALRKEIAAAAMASSVTVARRHTELAYRYAGILHSLEREQELELA